MGLFDKLFNNNNNEQEPQVAPQAAAPAGPGREVTLDLSKGGILNLQKNDFLNLTKTDSTLQDIRVSAGWDVQTSFFGSDFDLDLCAFLLDKDGYLVKGNRSVVYFSNKSAGGLQLDHDNLTGAGEGDDENMFVNFGKIASDVHSVLVCVVIYDGKGRRQSFSQVRNAYVRLVDQAVRPEKELARFNLSHDGWKATAVKFASLNRTDAGWTFKAVGDYTNASIAELKRSLQR